MEEYVRKIGTEKKTKFNEDLDRFIDLYQDKAKKMGYSGELKFNVEKGNVIIFAVIEEN